MANLIKFPIQWSPDHITYQDSYLAGTKFLSEHVCNAMQIARHLLCLACNFSKVDLIKNEKQYISKTEYEIFLSYLKRYHNKEPLSRIEGKKEFYGFEFDISSDTLDPRPETELLIDLLKIQYPDTKEKLHILDIGTGSGCLAVTAARIYQNSLITALDICEKAIIIAKINAQRANVGTHMEFRQARDNICETDINPCDVILCNPPYIPHSAKDYLDKSVTHFDPNIALFCGDNGLDFYYQLADFSSRNLKKHGFIFVEFGIGQAKCIKEIFAKYGLLSFNAFSDENNIIRAAKISF